jgi:NAD+ synthase (glutamine-hydrolysing)
MSGNYHIGVHEDPGTLDVDGLRCGLLICEDAWFDEPTQAAQAAGAQVLCVLNASPFHLGKGQEREQRMAERVRASGLPLLYAHLVGGQDEVVFDGASFAIDVQGRVAARACSFQDDLLIVEVSAAGAVQGRIEALPGQIGRAHV